jgi:hypothetical protein
MTGLWISGSFRGGESSVIAESIAGVLRSCGHRWTYWPIGEERPWLPRGFDAYVPLTQGPNSPLARLLLMGQMRRAFAQYDVVLVEQDLATEFLAAEVRAGLSRGPALWLLTQLALGHYLAGRGEARARRPRRLATALYPRFSRILCLLHGVADDLSSRFGVPAAQLVTLPWPALPADGPPPVAAPRVVTAGHVDGIMGLELLIQALHLIREEGVPAELTVYGDGPRLMTARQLAGSLEVPLAVHPLTPETAATLVGGGVYHAPQWLDGTGWQLVQAARVGLPLTAVSAPEAAVEVTRRGAMGKLVGLGNLEELKAALLPLLTDEAAWGGYHRGAKTLAAQYDAERVRDRWCEAFSAAGDPPTP